MAKGLPLLLLTALLALTGCDTALSLVIPEPVRHDMRVVRAPHRMAGVELGGPRTGTIAQADEHDGEYRGQTYASSPYGCAVSWPGESGPAYRYHSYLFFFDETIIRQGNGRGRAIRFVARHDDAPREGIVSMARCYIPDHGAAVRLVASFWPEWASRQGGGWGNVAYELDEGGSASAR